MDSLFISAPTSSNSYLTNFVSLVYDLQLVVTIFIQGNISKLKGVGALNFKKVGKCIAV